MHKTLCSNMSPHRRPKRKNEPHPFFLPSIWHFHCDTSYVDHAYHTPLVTTLELDAPRLDCNQWSSTTRNTSQSADIVTYSLYNDTVIL